MRRSTTVVLGILIDGVRVGSKSSTGSLVCWDMEAVSFFLWCEEQQHKPILMEKVILHHRLFAQIRISFFLCQETDEK
jgi:hypothetical protein